MRSVTSAAEKVYPRVCGGTAYRDVAAALDTGLSPRVRGNRRGRDHDGAGQGSIPACAGEPGRAVPLAGVDRVYPRVCGGTWYRYCVLAGAMGLSPRVRGNRSSPPTDPTKSGSIPACAGEPARDMLEG